MLRRSHQHAAVLAICCSLGALVVNAAACSRFGAVAEEQEDSGVAAKADGGTEAGAVEVGSPRADISDAGPLAWWRFDEGTGMTATDSSGNGNHGTLTNGATWGAGIAGGALSLDGVDDSMTVPETGTLALTETVSVAVWVKPSASTFEIAQQGRIVRRNSSWDIKFLEASPQFSVEDPNSPATPRFCIADTKFAADAWRHLVVIFVHGVVRFYVDGAPQAIRANKFTGTETLPPGSNGLRIGAFDSAKNFVGGLLDDLRIYDRELTVAEIQLLAQR